MNKNLQLRAVFFLHCNGRSKSKFDFCKSCFQSLLWLLSGKLVNYKHLFLMILEADKCKIKASADSISLESPFLSPGMGALSCCIFTLYIEVRGISEVSSIITNHSKNFTHMTLRPFKSATYQSHKHGCQISKCKI